MFTTVSQGCNPFPSVTNPCASALCWQFPPVSTLQAEAELGTDVVKCRLNQQFSYQGPTWHRLSLIWTRPVGKCFPL